MQNSKPTNQPDAKHEELPLTHDDVSATDRALDRIYAEDIAAGRKVFRPDFSKPMKPAK